MFFKKEEGYDQFLAESVAKGIADSQAGNVFPVEQVERELLEMIEQYAQDELESVAYA